MVTRPTDTRALSLLRHARDAHGYYTEALATDYAAEALMLEGVDEREARSRARRAWRKHFAIAGAI